MITEIELPRDPEDGLTADAVSAVVGYLLSPGDHMIRLERLELIEAWLDYCMEQDLVRESVTDVVITRAGDGLLRVQRANRSRSKTVLERFSAEFQMTMLQSPVADDSEVQAFVALQCIAEIVGELSLTQVDAEKLFGHLALRHGLNPLASASISSLRDQHRSVHRAAERFVGHPRTTR